MVLAWGAGCYKLKCPLYLILCPCPCNNMELSYILYLLLFALITFFPNKNSHFKKKKIQSPINMAQALALAKDPGSMLSTYRKTSHGEPGGPQRVGGPKLGLSRQPCHENSKGLWELISEGTIPVTFRPPTGPHLSKIPAPPNDAIPGDQDINTWDLEDIQHPSLSK